MTGYGIHGLKRRWVDDARDQGLHRPSAAWFSVTTQTSAAGLLATLTAATYFGLGTATQSALCKGSNPGDYHRHLSAHPATLPAVLVFPDQPTGRETTHRYLWHGVAMVAMTAPYTNVGRAGRAVAAIPDAVVLGVGLDDIAVLERRLDERAELASDSLRPQWWGGARPLTRLPCGDIVPVHTKLTAFCQLLGLHLAAEVGAAIGLRGEATMTGGQR
ncbi:hypothetical protein [Streptomyces sp. MI02-7b]|uniref:hypothetical protein n=1 Tax=Streptomyces sp. MI02-7b TaxID=462941 RepID=UPI0029AF0F04|nr:hypothetical protein [Streptomyces sp. MI02-7b]MDX3078380.1 hypothetical protein [Streptomyces sp. MI02-7b]